MKGIYSFKGKAKRLLADLKSKRAIAEWVRKGNKTKVG